MVKFVLYFVLSLFLCSASAKERNTLTGNIKKKIRIKDPLKALTRSSDFIRVIQEGSKLEAFFYDDIGSINISVYDNNSGVCVYQTDIETKIEKYIFIDLSFCSK